MRFAHQLDYGTSGVLLASLSRRAAGVAASCFKARSAQKSYHALVFGHPSRDTWRRTDGVSYDPSDPAGFKMRAHATSADDACCQPPAPAPASTAHARLSRADGLSAEEAAAAGVKACTTSFRVLARGVCTLEGPWAGADVAHVLATPLTGRRHQIRVHAAASGHPLLGDAAYSADADSFRLFLHAARLDLPLATVPLTREQKYAAKQADSAAAPPLPEALRLRAPLPPSFAVAMRPPPCDEQAE